MYGYLRQVAESHCIELKVIIYSDIVFSTNL